MSFKDRVPDRFHRTEEERMALKRQTGWISVEPLYRESERPSRASRMGGSSGSTSRGEDVDLSSVFTFKGEYNPAPEVLSESFEEEIEHYNGVFAETKMVDYDENVILSPLNIKVKDFLRSCFGSAYLNMQVALLSNGVHYGVMVDLSTLRKTKFVKDVSGIFSNALLGLNVELNREFLDNVKEEHSHVKDLSRLYLPYLSDKGIIMAKSAYGCRLFMSKKGNLCLMFGLVRGYSGSDYAYSGTFPVNKVEFKNFMSGRGEMYSLKTYMDTFFSGVVTQKKLRQIYEVWSGESPLDFRASNLFRDDEWFGGVDVVGVPVSESYTHVLFAYYFPASRVLRIGRLGRWNAHSGIYKDVRSPFPDTCGLVRTCMLVPTVSVGDSSADLYLNWCSEDILKEFTESFGLSRRSDLGVEFFTCDRGDVKRFCDEFYGHYKSFSVSNILSKRTGYQLDRFVNRVVKGEKVYDAERLKGFILSLQ